MSNALPSSFAELRIEVMFPAKSVWSAAPIVPKRTATGTTIRDDAELFDDPVDLISNVVEVIGCS